MRNKAILGRYNVRCTCFGGSQNGYQVSAIVQVCKPHLYPVHFAMEICGILWRYLPCYNIPTCQVRVARFYVSCLAFGPPPSPQLHVSDGSVRRRTSKASVGRHSSPPGLNRQLRTAVFPAGPQPPAPDGSVPHRTSTASSGLQCSPPDLNCLFRTAVCPAGPQPRVRRSARKMSEKRSEDMPDRMSEDVPERVSEDMPERVSEMQERMSDDMPEQKQ